MNLRIIDLDYIDEQIKELEKLKLRPEFTQEGLIGLSTQIGIFNEIKKQLQPITPIVENAFEAGDTFRTSIVENWDDSGEGDVNIPDLKQYLKEKNYE